jgi:hypothetical protein
MSFETRRKVLRKDNWALFDAESLLGECLTLQGRFTAAEPLLLKRYEAMKGNHTVPPHRLRAGRDRIVRLYSAWDKPEKAGQWRDQSPQPRGSRNAMEDGTRRTHGGSTGPAADPSRSAPTAGGLPWGAQPAPAIPQLNPLREGNS